MPTHNDIDIHRIRTASEKWSDMFLAGKQEVFDPAKYVARVSVEKQIEQFILGDKTATVLVGPSGAGKTVLFCMLARKYLAEGNLVLLDEGSQLVGAARQVGVEDLRVVIENTIARKLDLDKEIPLESSLTDINHLLDREGKYLFLFFDAVEKFNYGGAKVRELLLSLNSLIRSWTVHGLNRIKVFISCVTSAWDLLPTYQMLQWDLYFTPSTKYIPLVMDRYTSEEFELAYEKYMGLASGDDLELHVRVKATCEYDPYLLKIVSELDKELLPDLPADKVFDTYYEDKILHAGDGEARERFLLWFTRRMLECNKDEIPTVDIDAQDPAYELLVNEGILVRAEDKEPYPQFVTHLNHSRLSSYLLSRYLLREYDTPIPGEVLITLIDKASQGFFSLWRAIAEYLAKTGDKGLFLQLAGSPDYLHQEMVVDGLVELARRQPDKVGGVLRDFFQEESARPVALRTAVQLRRMADVRTEFGKWAWERPSEVANYVRILWKEYKDTKVGDGIWDELEAIRHDQMGPGIPVKDIESSMSIRLLATISWRIFLDDCHEPDSVKRLSQFWSETWELLLKDPRLRWATLPVVRSLFFVPALKKQLGNFIKWKAGLFLKEFASPEPDPKKALITEEWPELPLFPAEMRKVARLLSLEAEPSQFEASREEILSFLCSPPEPQYRMQVTAAAMATAIQTLHDFRRTKPTLEYLFEAGGEQGRLALLAAFSIYALGPQKEKMRLDKTGDDLIATIYDMTERVLTENPEYLTKMEDPWRLSRKYNMTLALAPLGFAYCNLSSSKKPYIEPILDLIRALGAAGDRELFRSSIRGLASVGIYFPDEALNTLAGMGAFATTDTQIMEETRETLRVIQVFNSTKVPSFLRQMEDRIRKDFAPERLIGRPLDLLLAYTQWIGNVNFVYHVASQYPTLRCILIGAILGLTAREGTSEQVIEQVVRVLIDDLFEKELSLEKLLYDPVENPESIIKKIAGKGYSAP